MTSRRTFLLGMASILATATAPGIIRASSLMKITSRFPELSESELERACIAIMRQTDSQGRLLARYPTKLIIPPSLAFVADRLYAPYRKAAEAGHLMIIPRIVVDHFQVNKNAWRLE